MSGGPLSRGPRSGPAAQFWSGRFAGLLGAALDLLLAAGMASRDWVATVVRARNLAAAGPGVRIQAGVVIRRPGQVRLGDGVRIGRHTILSTERLDGRLSVGSGTWMDRRCFIDFSGDLEIGSDCTLSEGVRIYTHDHGLDPRSEPGARRLRIGDRVWIGSGASVLQNVEEVGDGSIIGAEAVVTRRVPPGVVVAGNPARVLGPVGAREQRGVLA